MLLLALLLVPLAAGVVGGVLAWRPVVGWMTTAANGAVLAMGVALATRTAAHRSVGALDGALRADALAGFVGACVVLPQGIAYATLAGLPPQYGLFSAIVPVIVAALWGSVGHQVA